MSLHNFGGPDDFTSVAILRAQHESLMKFATTLLDQQRRITAEALLEIERELASWRRQVLKTVGASLRMLGPWFGVLALLSIVTIWLGARARDAWREYEAATSALELARAHGAVTVVRDGKLYVRVDPDSLAQGSGGNWYARAVSVDFRSSTRD